MALGLRGQIFNLLKEEPGASINKLNPQVENIWLRF